MASMPYAFLAISANFSASSFGLVCPKNARCSDHWAREILNRGAPSAPKRDEPTVRAPTPMDVRARKTRRLIELVMAGTLSSLRGLNRNRAAIADSTVYRDRRHRINGVHAGSGRGESRFGE